MPTELLNINELTRIVTATMPEAGHSTLLAALNDRYPNTPFRLLQEYDGRTWQVGIIDQNGDRVTDRLGGWIDQQLEQAGGSAQAVWLKNKDSGLIRTERVGSCLFMTAPYGPDQDQFYQMEILCGAKMTTKKLFDPNPDYIPEDRHDLISGPSLVFGDGERVELAPASYKFEKLVNMRKFLRDLVDAERAERVAQIPELEKKTIRIQEITLGENGGSESKEVPFLDLAPDWLEREPPAYRLFRDWSESSAGKGGHRICDHWWMQTNEWSAPSGKKSYSLIPQWAEADGGLALPEIKPDWDSSPYSVMESLLQFDREVGYDFAWYFYMLHGNKIGHSAGGVIATAVNDGLLNLPKCDETVLMRWRTHQFGF
jgi:hypothetical protein